MTIWSLTLFTEILKIASASAFLNCLKSSVCFQDFVLQNIRDRKVWSYVSEETYHQHLASKRDWRENAQDVTWRFRTSELTAGMLLSLFSLPFKFASILSSGMLLSLFSLPFKSALTLPSWAAWAASNCFCSSSASFASYKSASVVQYMLRLSIDTVWRWALWHVSDWVLLLYMFPSWVYLQWSGSRRELCKFEPLRRL